MRNISKSTLRYWADRITIRLNDQPHIKVAFAYVPAFDPTPEQVDDGEESFPAKFCVQATIYQASDEQAVEFATYETVKDVCKINIQYIRLSPNAEEI